jgi:hypothetical protein
MLMYHHQVRDLVRPTRLCQVLDDVVSSVYTVRVGEDEPHFFGELEEFRGRVARGGEEDFGVVDAGAGVFVVDVVGWIWEEWKREGGEKRQRGGEVSRVQETIMQG